MQQLTLEQFKADHLVAFDELIDETSGIDRFCSTTAWSLSAYESFAQQDAAPWIFVGEHGYALLYRSWHERIGHFAQPFEASWCLASPFATGAPQRLAEDFFATMHERRDEWDLLFLSGLQRDSPLYRALAARFSTHHFVGTGPIVSRHRASLEGGAQGFLSRRTPKFRANLRRVSRRAAEQHLAVERFTARDDEGPHWSALFDRIMALEARSWKGSLESGLRDEHMRHFYEKMIPRLIERDALRVIFLSIKGEDIAFVFGAVHGDLYRGLQVSFHDAYSKLSPGNLAQYMMIQSLVEEGVAWYDLGSEIEYKALWAEELIRTVPLVIRPW